jgi:hypothetical protein
MQTTRSVRGEMGSKAMMACVVVIAALGWTTQAEAVGFQFGGLFKGGGGSPSIINDADLDAMEEPSPGFDFGVQGFFLFAINPAFSVGVNFDYNYLDTEGRYGEYGWHMPSLGAMFRINSEVFAVSAWLNYMFASMDVNYDQNAINRTDASYNVNGIHFGFNPSIRIKIEPYRTYFEIGGYMSYSYLSLDSLPYTLRGTDTPSARDIEYGVTQYGVTLGVTFDVGGRSGGAVVHRQYGELEEDLY